MRLWIARILRRLLDRLGSTSADIGYRYADGYVTTSIVVDGVTYEEQTRLDLLLDCLGLPGDPVAALRKLVSYSQLNELDARCKMQARALREALALNARANKSLIQVDAALVEAGITPPKDGHYRESLDALILANMAEATAGAK